MGVLCFTDLMWLIERARVCGVVLPWCWAWLACQWTVAVGHVLCIVFRAAFFLWPTIIVVSSCSFGALGSSLVTCLGDRSHKATCKTRQKINDMGLTGTLRDGQRKWVLRRLLCTSQLRP